MSVLLQPPNDAQLKLLELVATTQQDYGAAPVWNYVEHEFDKVGLDATQVLSSLPFVGSPSSGSRHYGLVWADSNIPMPATRVHLTIAGRHHVQGIERSRIEAFIALLAKLVSARQHAVMSPVEMQTAYATRRELQKQASDPRAGLFEPGMIDQVRALVAREPVFLGAVTADPEDGDGWRIELRRELSLFKEVESVEQYIERVTELLTPPPAEPAEPVPSPLGLMAAFDFLDVVWRLCFQKPLVQPISAERTARLAFGVQTQEELSTQLSSLAQILKGLQVSRKGGGHPVQGIVPFLEENSSLDEAAIDRVRDAAAVLEAVVHIRNAWHHGGGQERGATATSTLGLSYPIADPAHAWQVIQNRVIAVLTTLREELYASYAAGS